MAKNSRRAEPNLFGVIGGLKTRKWGMRQKCHQVTSVLFLSHDTSLVICGLLWMCGICSSIPRALSPVSFASFSFSHLCPPYYLLVIPLISSSSGVGLRRSVREISKRFLLCMKRKSSYPFPHFIRGCAVQTIL